MDEKYKPTLAESFESYRVATAHYHPLTEPDPNYRPYDFDKPERVVEKKTNNRNEDIVKKLSSMQDVVSDLIFDLGSNWNKRTRNSVFHSVRINTEKQLFNIVSSLAISVPSSKETPTVNERPIIGFEFAKGERNGEMFGVNTDTFLSIILQGGIMNEKLYYLFDSNGVFAKLSNNVGPVKGIRKEIFEYGDNVVCLPAEKIDHTRAAVVLAAIHKEFSTMLGR